MSFQDSQDEYVGSYAEEVHNPLTDGGLLSEVFDVFFANASSFLLIMFLCVSPAFLFYLLGGVGVISYSIASGMASFSQLLLIPAQGAVVYGTVCYMAGYKPTMQENLSRGFASFFSVILVSIVVGFIIGFGFLLFIIPGFIFLMNYFLVIPVTVVEGGEIGESMRRSKELMKGFRFKVFLIVFSVVFMQMIVLGGMQYSIMMFLKLPGESFLMATHRLNASASASSAILAVSILFSALYATMSAVIYVRLRQLHDDVEVEQLAQVFE